MDCSRSYSLANRQPSCLGGGDVKELMHVHWFVLRLAEKFGKPTKSCHDKLINENVKVQSGSLEVKGMR